MRKGIAGYVIDTGKASLYCHVSPPVKQIAITVSPGLAPVWLSVASHGREAHAGATSHWGS